MGIVLPVEHSMKTPQDFLGCSGIAYVAIIFLTSINTLIGVSGAMRYGNETKGSVSLNLPKDEALSITSQLLMSISIVLTFGLVFQYFMGILWNHLEHRIIQKRHNISKVAVRFVIMVFMVIFALVIPNIEVLITIVGSIVSSSLSFIFPSAIQTVFIYPNFGRFKWQLWKNLTIIIFGLFILFTGIYVSVLDIKKLYQA